MPDFDVAILGGGSAAEMAAEHLAAGDKSVVVLEPGYVGGECPFTACVPSKALLHAAASNMSWRQAVEFRDVTTQHRDDSGHAKSLQRKGIELIRQRGTITGPGRLTAGDRELTWTDLVVATGGDPAIPPITGIEDIGYWTSDAALTASADEQPGTLLILGGGPIGCELAQAFARLGSEVTLVESASHLLPGEPAFVADILTEALRLDGVEVVTEAVVEQVTSEPGQVVLRLDDGDRVMGDRLLVATGKRPRVSGFGLGTLGITIEPGDPIRVDDRGRVTVDGSPMEHLYAAGDVTAVAPYTHGANAQARAVAATILGRDEPFDGRAIPRCVYTDPAVMAVGSTNTGDDVVTAGFDVGDTARAAVEERKVGHVEVFADRRRGIVVGAALIGPEVDAWGVELSLAIQAEVPIATLARLVHAFPTYGESMEPIYTDLLGQLSEDPGGRQGDR